MKVLIISDIAAPYRIAVFKGLAKAFDVTVFFNKAKNDQRNSKWYVKADQELPFYVLNSDVAKEKYQEAVDHIAQYDVVICYDPWAPRSRSLQRLCMRKGVPYILNADGALSINKQFPKKQIKTFYVKRAALSFAGCSRAVDYFKAYGAKEHKIVKHPFTSLYAEQIIKAPYTPKQKAELRTQLGMADGVVFLTVGQFIYRKGFDLLLEAWEKTEQNAHLYIIGGGPLRSEYEQCVSQKQLKNVHVLDFIPPKEVIWHYLAADAFIMPTREDIWGLVVNEAMACGLPVITSSNCTAGNELVVNDVSGYIYTCEDTDSLARYVDKLKNDPELRNKFAHNALEAIRSHTYENIIDSHIASIRSVVQSD